LIPYNIDENNLPWKDAVKFRPFLRRRELSIV
jgi:hypothetical protein